MLPRLVSRRLTVRKTCCPREGRQDSRSAGRDAGPYRHKQHLAMIQSYPGTRIPRARIPGERWPCFPSPLAYEGLRWFDRLRARKGCRSRSENPLVKQEELKKDNGQCNCVQEVEDEGEGETSQRLEVLLSGTKKPPTMKFRHGQRLHCFSRGAGD